MKHLPLCLFIVYLLFISAKSLFLPVTGVELGILSCLLVMVFGEKIIKLIHRLKYKEYLLRKEDLEMQRPVELNPEIESLRDETEIERLRLQKFLTEQEYHKREIAKAVEAKVGDGGFRF